MTGASIRKFSRKWGIYVKTLGVIGGLGPMATAYYMQLVIEMTEAGTDQEHIPMILYNKPQIPDRTSFLLGRSKENPTPQIIDCGKRLTADGADLIAIPCITAHALHEQIQKQDFAAAVPDGEKIDAHIDQGKPIGQLHPVPARLDDGPKENRFRDLQKADRQQCLP